MLLKLSFIVEFLTTFFTRFSVIMSKDVIFQMTKSYETLIAAIEVTEEGSFSSMCSHMDLDIAFLCESLMTDLTFKWLLTGVRSFMNLKSALSLKAFLAKLTFEWKITGVDKFVSLQMTS